jgi:putative peptidoglycan lipid II flippase
MQIGRTALLLVPLAVLARGSAFGVTIALALWFGVDRATDAYFYAVAFPVLALALFSNAIGIALTPALAEALTHRPEEAADLTGAACVGGALLGGILGLITCLVLPSLLPALTAFDSETLALAERFLWELWPYMAMTPVTTALRVGCEVKGAFRQATLSPAVRAVATILGTWLLLEPVGPDAMPLGLLVGEVAQLGWHWLVLAREGVVVRPRLAWTPGLAQVARDSVPILGAELMVASNMVVDKLFAGAMPAGAVAVLEYADRARIIPQVLLASTLMPVAYASWSHMAARGEAGFGEAVDQSLRWVGALAAPVLAGMFIARVPLVQWMFERGAFTAQDTWDTAQVLRWYLPGVWPMLLGLLALRAHVLRRRIWLLFGLALISVVHNAAWNLALIPTMGLEGIALATSLNLTVVPALFLWALRRDLADAATWSGWWPVLAAAAGSAVVAGSLEALWGPADRLLAPQVIGGAVLCSALLAAAFRATRPPMLRTGRSAGSSGP